MLTYVSLVASAFGAGVVNALAGGGTLLTFPTLLSSVSAVVANGTNTVALFPGSLAGVWAFRQQLAACRSWLLLLTPPSLLGGALGAGLVQADSFQALIPWLILTASLLFMMQPLVVRLFRRPASPAPPTLPVRIGIVIVQLLIAIYGGYFGAGIGILMLSTLAFLGLESIHQVNALKNFLALCINATAAVVFVARGQVNWPFALAMTGAAIVGGYAGARFSLRLPQPLIRGIVIVIGLSLSAYYFYRELSRPG